MSFDTAFDYVRILSLIPQEEHPQKLSFKTPFIRFWQIRISTALPLQKDSHAEHPLCWQQVFFYVKKAARNFATPNCFCQRSFNRRHATKQSSVKHNLQRHLNFLQFRITFYFWTIC